jgi:hypothetical protein
LNTIPSNTATILEYFGQSIEYNPNAITDRPEGYKRLSYQMDAVTSGYWKYVKPIFYSLKNWSPDYQ